LRPSSAKSWPPIFCADCELDHIPPRITGARWSSPDGASQFQYPGVGKVAWRYTALAALFLCARLFGGSAARAAHAKRMPIGLSKAIAVATRFGHLLDFPEHPHKGNAEADDNAQKQQREAGGCKHGEYP